MGQCRVESAFERGAAFCSGSFGARADRYPRLSSEWHLRAPDAALLGVARGAGHLNFHFDRFGRARELPLFTRSLDLFYPAFALATARSMNESATLQREQGESLLLNYPYGAPLEVAAAFVDAWRISQRLRCERACRRCVSGCFARCGA
jgi:hypothetical protein